MAALFEDDERQDISAVNRMLEEQSRKETEEALKRFRERNRKENLKRHGCDCPAAKCYLTCPRYLAHSKEDDLFYYLKITRPEDNRVKEAIMHLRGGATKGSGSKSGRKRKKPPKRYYNPYL